MKNILNPPKIGIVTVLYKSETVLSDFFESLNCQTYKNFSLYVVDNKSPDNSLLLIDKLKRRYSFDVVIIANEDNYGIAKGNNIGIKKALEDGCDWILLSNNDVAFGENTIELLLNGTAINNRVDMFVPKIYFWNTNLLWFAGGRYSFYNGWTVHRGYKKEDCGHFNIPQRILYAPTCFMLIRSSVFDKVGFMDENYFVYWDDTDFVSRALKENLKLWYIPQSVVYHKESTSTGKQSDFSVYYLNRNFIYFICKNRSFFQSIYYILFQLFVHVLKRIFVLSFHQWKLVFKAYIDGFILFYKK